MSSTPDPRQGHPGRDADPTSTSHKKAQDPEDPRKPDSLSDIKKPSWKYTLKSALREFNADNNTDSAAALTYYAVLSLFPALIALVSILSLVGQGQQTTDAIVNMASDFVPEQTMETLGPIIETLTTAPAPGLGLVIGLLTALWTASNYVNAFSRAMNQIYEVPEGRPFYKLRPAMYGLTALLLVLVALVGLMLVLSGPVAEAVGNVVGLGSTAVTVWNIAKWPVVLIAVIIIVALLYYFTPNVEQPKFRWISVGAVVAIVIAIVAALAFGFYVGNFGSYSATYGTLAGVIIFLLLLYIVNLALLFGAEVDAETERSRQLQAGIPAEEDIQLPPRDTKASDKKAEKEREAIARGRKLRETAGESDKLDSDKKK